MKIADSAAASTARFTIAVVEDDEVMGEALTSWITEMGHACALFSRGAELLSAMRQTNYSLFVLDWGLPDIQGIDLLRHLRSSAVDAPVVFCTSRGSEADVVAALHVGADDFIVKPVRRYELSARVNAALRRAYPAPVDTGRLEVPPFRIDLVNRVIYSQGSRIELQNREFALAVMLFQNLNGVVSRTRIIQTLWGAEPIETSRSLDTHISRVRRKLELTPERGLILQSVYGLGYRLQSVSASPPA